MTRTVIMIAAALGLMAGSATLALAADNDMLVEPHPQPDSTPSKVATTSKPRADRDTAIPDEPEAMAENAYDAMKSGRWLVLIGIVLMALVKLVRRYGGQAAPWLLTDRGGVVTALALALLTEIALLLASGRSPTFSGFMGALAAAWAASGGWVQLQRLLRPRDKPPAVPQPAVVPPPSGI